MADQTEIRRIDGGLDTVTAPSDIKDGAFLNAINFRTVAAQGRQQAGSGNFIAGNQEIAAVSAALRTGTNQLVGKTTAPELNRLFLFYYNAAGSYILSYNLTTDIAAVIFDDTKVAGGLKFSANTFVDARVAGNLLIWVMGIGDVRYLSLGVDYMAGGLLPELELSLLAEPPVVPLTTARNNSAGINSTVQFNAVQFTYRFVNRDGLTSVLAPYSLTSFPPRETAIAANANSGNTITITVPTTQKIPSDWKYVDMVVRFPDQEAFFVIKRWSKFVSADATAINNHNLGSALTFNNWAGVVGERLDSTYIAKQNDQAPINPATLEAVANRIIVGNFQEGYDTPSINATLNITPNAYIVNSPNEALANVWLVSVKKYDVDEHYFALVIREGTTNYLLPKECSIGFFKWGQLPNPGTVAYNQPVPLGAPVFGLSNRIHRSALIKLQELGNFLDTPTSRGPANVSANATIIRPIREKIVVEANSLVNFQSEWTGSGGIRFDHWLFFYSQIILMDDAPEASGTGKNRALLPGAQYNLSLQLYDAALRKPGRQSIMATYNAPTLTSFIGNFVESISINPVLISGTLPDWAAFYSVVISKNQLTSRVIHFVSGLIRVAISENDRIVYRGRSSYPTGSPIFTRGIAFPISQLASAGYGYEYQEGDILEYAYTDNNTLVFTTGRLVIREVVDGYIITYDDAGQLSKIQNMLAQRLESFQLFWTQANYQNDMAISNAITILQPEVTLRILSRNQTDTDLYEVALFGEVVSSGGIRTFGNFFSSGTTTGRFFGDTHLQARFGPTGSATAVAITTNERNSLNWITDAGRISPEDNIGNAYLPGAYRWSNVHLPGAATNGYANFDALDVGYIDETAGPIRAMVLTTRNNQDGGQLLILCENGSYVMQVGKQELSDANGSANISITKGVFSDPNMLRGEYGCTSPRSVSRWQHRVWWVDTIKGEVIEFNDGGAGSIAGMGMTALFRETLARVIADGDTDRISTGVNPYTREMMLSIPASNPVPQPDLNTVTGLENPFEAYANAPATWFFDYEKNRWQTRYESGAEFINIADKIFGWKDGKLWREFTGAAGDYYGNDGLTAVIAIPFNANPSIIKTALAVRVVAQRPPIAAWVMCNSDGMEHVAGTVAFERKERFWRAGIRRDRTSGGASDETAWNAAGVEGSTLKDDVISVALIFAPDSSPINLNSVSLEWEVSQGQGKLGN